MRHRNAGRKFKRTPSHRKMMLRNLATALLEHGRIETTLAKAKELQPYVEKLITLAKDGWDLNNFRKVLAVVTIKQVAFDLFHEVGPRFKGRPGGYTRIYKLAKLRQGDAAPMAVITLLGEKEQIKAPAARPRWRRLTPERRSTADRFHPEVRDLLRRVPDLGPFLDRDTVREAAMPTDCLFCRIVAGAIPAAKVYEDAEVVAFLDIHPVNFGHVLIVPKPHHATLAELPDALAEAAARQVPRLSRAILAATDAPGLHLIVNNGVVAGQTIHHVHWHLIPRFAGDAVDWPWPHQAYPDTGLDAMRGRIAEKLTG